MTRSKHIGALTLGTLVLAAVPALAQEPLKPWTLGTTQAANEVVGARSGLRFAFIPPPVPDQPPPIGDMPHLTAATGPVEGIVQIADLSLIPPPTNDLPPGPISVRVRLLPPGPVAPARLEVQLLDMANVTLLDANGAPVALCIPGPQ